MSKEAYAWEREKHHLRCRIERAHGLSLCISLRLWFSLIMLLPLKDFPVMLTCLSLLTRITYIAAHVECGERVRRE